MQERKGRRRVMKPGYAAIITGLLLSFAFIGIALFVLFFPDRFPAASRQDFILYSALTGSYGIWRLLRVIMTWKEAQKNI
jgi:hypothetical protein